jgi:hypothetical protein
LIFPFFSFKKNLHYVQTTIEGKKVKKNSDGFAQLFLVWDMREIPRMFSFPAKNNLLA